MHQHKSKTEQRTLPNGTFARPNNGILDVIPLNNGFSAVACPRGRLFSGVCWSCTAEAIVGSNSTLSPTEHNDGSVLLVVPLTPYQVWEIALAARVCSSFDIERIRRGRYGWNDEGREFVWGLKMVDEVENQAYGWSFAPPFLCTRSTNHP